MAVAPFHFPFLMIHGTASHAVPKRQQALLRNTIPTGCEIRARRNCSGVTIGYEPLRITANTQRCPSPIPI